MRNSWIVLILSSMVLSNLAYSTLANCPTCAGETPDWTTSAIDFLEGKPVNNTPSSLNGPQQARLLDAQIDSRKRTNQTSNDANMPVLSPTSNSMNSLNIVLDNISAVPNPSNLGDPVKIVAVFRNNGTVATSNSLSNITNSGGMTVYADIKNAAGIEVARVNLRQTSGNGYTGIWYANVGSGIYNATIDASGVQGSKVFNEALRIVVKESKSPIDNTHAIRKLG